MAKLQVVEEALEKGHDGICRILDIMADCIDTPRMDKANLPVTESLEIPSHKRRKFVGPGGVNLRKITSETGVQANQMEDNAWSLFAPNREAMDEAKVLIDSLLRDDASIPEFEFGAIVPVKILDVKERGATVELHPGLEPAFIHVSQLSASKVGTVDTLLRSCRHSFSYPQQRFCSLHVHLSFRRSRMPEC